jgi:hypothetical protein
MPTLTPKAGAIGLLEGQKEAGKRVDFKPDDYVLLVETKGYRLAWSRAAFCPCKPINLQTDQSDPTCTLCEGSGWLRFRPEEAVINSAVIGELDELQQSIVDDNAAVIRGIMTSITNKREPYDHVMARLEGTMNVTARHENKLGYHDRLVNLDSTIVFSEVLDYDGAGEITLRYPARYINLIRSSSQIFGEVSETNPTGDYRLEVGKVVWESGKGPPTDERLAVHYLTHPTWRVVEHPHAMRTTPVKFKTTSAVGDAEPLPVQAVSKLEFLL